MRVPRGDDGQAMSALVIFLVASLLAFGVIVLLPVGAATNDKTRSQTAADAAALAALESFRHTWVYDVTEPRPLLRFTPGPAVGLQLPRDPCATAREYAARHDANTTCSTAATLRGRVEVRATNRYASYEPNGQAASEATARTKQDIDAVTCLWTDFPVPLPPPPPAPGGAPFFEATLDCGDWEATYRITNVTGPTFWSAESYASFEIGIADGLYDDLEPRLVE